MGFIKVTHVYHVDKAQLRLNIDQCTWNLHNSQQKDTQYFMDDLLNFSALNLPS